LFLAPVAGYSDRAFRSICVEQGADFTCTELISAESLIRRAPEGPGAGKTAGKDRGIAAALLARAPNEKHYAVQLFGADPQRMYAAARMLAPWRPDAVDINAGCPVPKVTKTGAGSALMKDPAGLGSIVAAVVRASRESLGGVPVTVKMRSGWDNSSINYIECALAAVEAGAAMISLHPRTRAQGYGGKSEWAYIADLAARLRGAGSGGAAVPVTGSGDLTRSEDAERMLRETGCAAVMFARGAGGNPFIFSETRSLLETGRRQITGAEERLKAALRHLDLLAADIGERSACLEMRKAFCAYAKGGEGRACLSGAANLRNRLVRAETIAEYRKLLHDAGIA
jgi:nifR3 family TIM-barrel protein